jgi:predicted enzyme related to lactoylglutathione lyase
VDGTAPMILLAAGRPTVDGNSRASREAMMLSLSTVMINSEDPAALSAFYRKVLGEPGYADNGYVGWQVGSAGLMIGPHSEVKGANEMPGRIMLNFETSDVKGEFDRLKALGATVEQEPYQPGPAGGEGNFFQLASPMPVE